MHEPTDGLEPNAVAPESVQHSMAISLKRIADTLEQIAPAILCPPYQATGGMLQTDLSNVFKPYTSEYHSARQVLQEYGQAFFSASKGPNDQ